MNSGRFLLFPGQGAQVVGMGRDVYDAGGRPRELFDLASEILGLDLPGLVFQGEADILARTENCQPALLVTSIALLEALRASVRVRLTGAAGLSLGEYTALVALGSITFEDGVRLVRRRGELMASAGGDGETGMYSVIGLDDRVVEEACQQAADAGVVVPANYNAPGQVVISGQLPALRRAAEICKQAGARRVLPLRVSAAFHSPCMQPACDGFMTELAGVEIRPPAGRFINNADARELCDPDAIRDALARQLVSPVRWSQSCKLAVEGGARDFLEVGPGKVCRGLMKRIDRDARVVCVEGMAQIRQLAGDHGEASSDFDRPSACDGEEA